MKIEKIKGKIFNAQKIKMPLKKYKLLFDIEPADLDDEERYFPKGTIIKINTIGTSEEHAMFLWCDCLRPKAKKYEILVKLPVEIFPHFVKEVK